MNNKPVRCHEHFKCKKTECPAFTSAELECWLTSGTFCSEEPGGIWLEKVEDCMACEVFKKNLNTETWQKTLRLLSSQFIGVREKLELEHAELKKTERKLNEFKISSIHL